MSDQAHLHDAALLAEWFENLAKTIAIDFDGVLHPYTEGWVGSIPADEVPMAGAMTFLTQLRDEGYRLVVFSTRADHNEGLDGINDWLVKHDLAHLIDDVTHEKPPAIAYVDDRAVPFFGRWGDVRDGIDRLAKSRPHGAATAE